MKTAQPEQVNFIESIQNMSIEMDMIIEHCACRQKRWRKSYWFHTEVLVTELKHQ